MTEYSLELSKKVTNSNMKLYKLHIDGECKIDQFEEEIERDGQYIEDLDGLYAIIGKACNQVTLPNTMYRVLQTGKLPIQVHEAKKGKLRYYLIKIKSTGKVIIAAGMKADQKGDIEIVKKLAQKIKNAGDLTIKSEDK